MSLFNPQFTWVDSIKVCADMINRPHNDYPKRVKATENVIQLLINFTKKETINSFEARTIHSIIFPDLQFTGKWRECNVKIGDDFPINYLKVPEEIERIFPVEKSFRLKDWYKRFQIIHPFEDGNGRVAGCIIAVLSWDGEKMLAPLQ